MFPPLFDLRSTYGGGNEDNGDLLQKVPCKDCCTQCPKPSRRALLNHASARDSWTLTGKSGQSFWGHYSILLGPGVHKILFVPSKSLSPVLCKLWKLYGGVNGNLFQEGLCHSQVYCTQSPCLCSSALLTGTSAGDTQTQFCLWLCGLWVLVCTRFI